MSRICSLKLSNLSLAQAVGSAGLWVIGAALCPVSPTGHTFEWADTGQRLCVQTRGYAFFPPKSSKLLLTDESSTPFSESPSLSLSISKAQLTWWRRSFSVPFHVLASVNVFPSTKLCFLGVFLFFFSCAKTLVTEERFTIFYLKTFIFTLLPSSSLPTSDLFLSPPSSHFWKSISGHTIRAEGGERRNLPAWDCTWMPRKAGPAVRSYCSACQRLPVLMSLYIIIVIMSDDWGGPCTMEGLNVDPESHWMKS